MIAAVFPNGTPAREEVIRSVNAWLDEAERLPTLEITHVAAKGPILGAWTIKAALRSARAAA